MLLFVLYCLVYCCLLVRLCSLLVGCCGVSVVSCWIVCFVCCVLCVGCWWLFGSSVVAVRCLCLCWLRVTCVFCALRVVCCVLSGVVCGASWVVRCL